MTLIRPGTRVTFQVWRSDMTTYPIEGVVAYWRKLYGMQGRQQAVRYGSGCITFLHENEMTVLDA